MVKKRILVVDDLAIFREPIGLALQQKGYKVFTAVDGAEAIKIVEASVQGFDLMIVDYLMPEMDGLTFISRARTYAHMLEVPSLMLTDMADKDIVLNAYKIGVKDYILKSSFSLSGLIDKVETLIQG